MFWLFLAMGIPWTFDCLTGYIKYEDHITILTFDMFNALQGFVIFLIYSLKFGFWDKVRRFCQRPQKQQQVKRPLALAASATVSASVAGLPPLAKRCLSVSWSVKTVESQLSEA